MEGQQLVDLVNGVVLAQGGSVTTSGLPLYLYYNLYSFIEIPWYASQFDQYMMDYPDYSISSLFHE